MYIPGSTQRAAALALAGILSITAALMTGCGKQNDTISQAGKKDAVAGVTAPSVAEVKAIAEEGFI